MVPVATAAETQHQRLRAIFQEMGSVLVSYSGGIDSTVVLAVAHATLGDRAVGATSVSPTLPEVERTAAGAVARTLGARYVEVPSDVLKDANFFENPESRCYTCKRDLYRNLARLAADLRLAHIANGTNVDDLGDYRPGLRAAKELGVRSPLLEAGMTKDDVRRLARDLGLPNWMKPAEACLSSRFPFGTAITADRLQQVEQAEEVLHAAGFAQVRVRFHDEVARLEIPPADFSRLLDPETRDSIVTALRGLGFAYIALDLQGYRSGSLNLRVVP